jgi:hypothetical protein
MKLLAKLKCVVKTVQHSCDHCGKQFDIGERFNDYLMRDGDHLLNIRFHEKCDEKLKKEESANAS